MTTLGEAMNGPTHPRKARLYTIACSVWPDLAELQAHEGGRRLGYVEDVLAGLPCPVISRKEREAIEEAAKEIPA